MVFSWIKTNILFDFNLYLRPMSDVKKDDIISQIYL